MEKINFIKSHFKKNDRVIYDVMTRMTFNFPRKRVLPANYFMKLTEDIIGQQLGSRAADAIVNRFTGLFPNKKITPENVLAIPDQKLRDVGMSWAKARYIKNLALKTTNHEISLDTLHNVDDEAVITELIKVKGIGRWTAEMFLMFTLGRENVYSHGDLGLKNAMKKLYGFKGKPGIRTVEKIVKKWSPYKTYGCLALWSIFD